MNPGGWAGRFRRSGFARRQIRAGRFRAVGANRRGLANSKMRVGNLGGLQQKHHLAVSTRRQQIVPSMSARRLLLRRQPRTTFDAMGGRGAEPAFGLGNGRRLGLTQTRMEPHLTAGNVATGQAAAPHRREQLACCLAHRDRQKTPPMRGLSVARFVTSAELPRAYVPHPAGNVLVLIDGRSLSGLLRSMARPRCYHR